MVIFTQTASIVLLATLASAAALHHQSNALVTRQASLPDECTEYCSISAGCVCIRRPTNCVATYLVDAGENCGTVVSRFNNFTSSDLYAWNPEIGQTCFGLRAYVPVCIGVPGYTYPGPVEGGDIWTPEQIPVPVQPGIVANCTKFEYTDAKGVPTLANILKENNITKYQWNSWNVPSQDPTQDWAAWAQYFSCVEA
ncbi:carbohydrate-binding module family 50 protein [Lentithecium fluviatile CBS 122367]|uniref:Carbohydrate-binding module family 50 protein n=1 Tax=Lentithecium fluviatile CBS 122367 TaxID=1168545 RepID=A0A6G1JF34_9PLEO|nr:carbohydrate-binding module family 50 protein [Lentithecium fluviatile CBS 122367]